MRRWPPRGHACSRLATDDDMGIGVWLSDLLFDLFDWLPRPIVAVGFYMPALKRVVTQVPFRLAQQQAVSAVEDADEPEAPKVNCLVDGFVHTLSGLVLPAAF